MSILDRCDRPLSTAQVFIPTLADNDRCKPIESYLRNCAKASNLNANYTVVTGVVLAILAIVPVFAATLGWAGDALSAEAAEALAITEGALLGGLVALAIAYHLHYRSLYTASSLTFGLFEAHQLYEKEIGSGSAGRLAKPLKDLFYSLSQEEWDRFMLYAIERIGFKESRALFSSPFFNEFRQGVKIEPREVYQKELDRRMLMALCKQHKPKGGMDFFYELYISYTDFKASGKLPTLFDSKEKWAVFYLYWRYKSDYSALNQLAAQVNMGHRVEFLDECYRAYQEGRRPAFAHLDERRIFEAFERFKEPRREFGRLATLMIPDCRKEYIDLLFGQLQRDEGVNFADDRSEALIPLYKEFYDKGTLRLPSIELAPYTNERAPSETSLFFLALFGSLLLTGLSLFLCHWLGPDGSFLKDSLFAGEHALTIVDFILLVGSAALVRIISHKINQRLDDRVRKDRSDQLFLSGREEIESGRSPLEPIVEELSSKELGELLQRMEHEYLVQNSRERTRNSLAFFFKQCPVRLLKAIDRARTLDPHFKAEAILFAARQLTRSHPEMTLARACPHLARSLTDMELSALMRALYHEQLPSLTGPEWQVYVAHLCYRGDALREVEWLLPEKLRSQGIVESCREVAALNAEDIDRLLLNKLNDHFKLGASERSIDLILLCQRGRMDFTSQLDPAAWRLYLLLLQYRNSSLPSKVQSSIPGGLPRDSVSRDLALELDTLASKALCPAFMLKKPKISLQKWVGRGIRHKTLRPLLSFLLDAKELSRAASLVGAEMSDHLAAYLFYKIEERASRMELYFKLFHRLRRTESRIPRPFANCISYRDDWMEILRQLEERSLDEEGEPDLELFIAQAEFFLAHHPRQTLIKLPEVMVGRAKLAFILCLAKTAAHESVIPRHLFERLTLQEHQTLLELLGELPQDHQLKSFNYLYAQARQLQMVDVLEGPSKLIFILYMAKAGGQEAMIPKHLFDRLTLQEHQALLKLISHLPAADQTPVLNYLYRQGRHALRLMKCLENNFSLEPYAKGRFVRFAAERMCAIRSAQTARLKAWAAKHLSRAEKRALKELLKEHSQLLSLFALPTIPYDPPEEPSAFKKWWDSLPCTAGDDS